MTTNYQMTQPKMATGQAASPVNQIKIVLTGKQPRLEQMFADCARAFEATKTD